MQIENDRLKNALPFDYKQKLIKMKETLLDFDYHPDAIHLDNGDHEEVRHWITAHAHQALKAKLKLNNRNLLIYMQTIT